MFTITCHRFLSRASRIQCTTSNIVLLGSILILSSHLCLGFLSGLFLSDLPIRILFSFLLSHVRVICYFTIYYLIPCCSHCLTTSVWYYSYCVYDITSSPLAFPPILFPVFRFSLFSNHFVISFLFVCPFYFLHFL